MSMGDAKVSNRSAHYRAQFVRSRLKRHFVIVEIWEGPAGGNLLQISLQLSIFIKLITNFKLYIIVAARYG